MEHRTLITSTLLLQAIGCWAQVHPTHGFMPNLGQFHDQHRRSVPEVRYVWPSGEGVSVAVCNDGFSYDTNGPRPDAETRDFHRIDIRFLGGNPFPFITAEEPLRGVSNFYGPNTGRAGITRVPHYGKLVMHDVYDGIDVVCFAGDHFEYEFILRPGADIDGIRIAYEGCAGMALTDDGLGFPLSTFPITESIPASWALPGRVPVAVRYRIIERTANGLVAGLELEDGASMPTDATLVIDPVLERGWGSYFGGSAADASSAIAVDTLGKAYIAGRTASLITWITTGDHQGTFAGGGSDAYLAKFASHGSCFWSTYYGGSGDDEALAVHVDGRFHILLAGVTSSTDLPQSAGAVQDSLAGASDMFIAKFDSTGVRLWGTYFGGTGADTAFACALDEQGRSMVTGSTNSTSMSGLDTIMPVQSYAGMRDAFTVALTDSGTVRWATWSGGPDDDAASGLALDTAGRAVVVGRTSSMEGIATSGTVQEMQGGEEDGFVLVLDTIGVRVWGSYVGGTSTDMLHDVVCVDDHIFLAGATRSADLQTAGDSLDSELAGTQDGIIARLDADGTLVWCCYLGGDSIESVTGLDRDRSGALYIGGTTSSIVPDSTIATTGSWMEASGGASDGFIQKYDGDGHRVWGSYYGGEQDDAIVDIGVYGITLAFVAGTTASQSGIAQDGLYDGMLGGGTDGFVARLVQEESTMPSGICNGGGGSGGSGGTGNEQPTDAIHICFGDSVMLTLSGGALGIGAEWMWYAGSCGDPPDFIGSGDTLIVAPTANVTIYVRAEAALDVTLCEHVNIVVEPYAQGTAYADTPVCAGGSVQLHAAGGDVYVWGGVDSASVYLQHPVAGPLDTLGIVVFPVFISSPHGCGDTSFVTVEVFPLPLAVVSATGITCHAGVADGSVSVALTDPQDTVQWTTLYSSALLIEGLAPGAYPVTITSLLGCAVQLIAEVTEPPPLIGSVQVQTATCGAANGVATVLLNGDTSGVVMLWDQGLDPGFINAALLPGTGVVVVASDQGCMDSATYVIADTGSFTISIVPDTVLIPNNGSTTIEAFVSPIGMAVDLVWWPDSSLSCADCPEVVATPPFHQLYTVSGANTFGCTARDSVYVMLDLRIAEFFLPDVFSPNGDGLNDALCVFGDVVTMRLRLFDKWGAVVFASDDPGRCWDGTFRGKPVDPGLYAFALEAVMKDGSLIERSGNIRSKP